MTGCELWNRREEMGLSQRGLARRAGIHQRAVSYWENKPNLDLGGYAVKRMAEALGWRNLPPLTPARGGVLSDAEEEAIIADILSNLPRGLAKRIAAPRVTCGAKTRKGAPCRAKSEPWRRRCRFHGGHSTGPMTPEGRARIAEAQRRRWANEGQVKAVRGGRPDSNILSVIGKAL